ncbi:cytochrome c family protein [Egicoccus sp. AB-alg2]|uniref:c-type cytochrome n=1 Tax=Egicoccus sp. AB-alg2 TaxID=3242693 RepID=UPI00359E4A9A
MRTPRPLFPVLAVVGVVGLLQGCDDGGQPVAFADVEHGREQFVGYGCGACHQVDGIRQARGRVGPDLSDLPDQRIVAGQLPNTPEQVSAFIQNPQEYAPGTGMPNLGVTPEDAEAITAFLFDQG